MAIHISFRGVIHSQPRLLHSTDLVACLFSVKSGSDILSVATEPNAINVFKKGDTVSIKGVFSPKTAMVGVTEILSINASDSTNNIVQGKIPVESIPQQTRRKPNKDGLYDVPKAVTVEKDSKNPTGTNSVFIATNNTGKVPQPTNSGKKSETKSGPIPTVSTPTEFKAPMKKKPSSNSAAPTSQGTLIDGLPLPTFGTKKTSTPTHNEEEKKEAPVFNCAPQTAGNNVPANNTSSKKTRWTMDDFNMDM